MSPQATQKNKVEEKKDADQILVLKLKRKRLQTLCSLFLFFILSSFAIILSATSK